MIIRNMIILMSDVAYSNHAKALFGRRKIAKHVTTYRVTLKVLVKSENDAKISYHFRPMEKIPLPSIESER